MLSAGAVHSPTVLMRSGIGRAGQLRALGIDVVADLPVGQGLQDHHPLAGVAIPLKGASALGLTITVLGTPAEEGGGGRP